MTIEEREADDALPRDSRWIRSVVVMQLARIARVQWKRRDPGPAIPAASSPPETSGLQLGTTRGRQARRLKRLACGLRDNLLAEVAGIAFIALVTFIVGGLRRDTEFFVAIDSPPDEQHVEGATAVFVHGTYGGSLGDDKLYVVVHQEVPDSDMRYWYTPVEVDDVRGSWSAVDPEREDGFVSLPELDNTGSALYSIAVRRCSPREAGAIDGNLARHRRAAELHPLCDPLDLVEVLREPASV